MFTARPYSQRATIKNKTQEQVYEAVRSWLALNACSVKRARPPTYIEAEYKANRPLTQVGLKDDFPKDIEIRITAFGSDAIFQMTVTQQDPRFKDKGFLYWGSRIEGLLYALESQPSRDLVLSLYPKEMIKKEIRDKVRFYGVVTAASMLVLAALPFQLDFVVLVFFFFVAPVILIGVLDTVDYRRLLKATESSGL